MDKNAIKKYAVWARRELIERVSQRALVYGITAKDAGDPNAESVNGHLLSQAEKRQRQALIRNIKEKGYEQVMEEVAYTWFNRFAALRFMEVNGYLPSHIRVFTNDAGEFKPQILAEAIHLELDGLDMNKVYELESANKSEELFKYLLIVQCNALNSILPGMFQRIEDYTELLLPDYLLREGSVIEQMVTTIPEEDWTDQVQIIGWLYQYYNTELKDTVFAKIDSKNKVGKNELPAATELFTPDWIVRYMVENSLGRLWLDGHPNDALKSEWRYYLDEAEQKTDVQAQLATIRRKYADLKPEEIRVIDPCMGSGHILCILFDVLVRIYEDYGYTAREAANSIIENNIYGLDVDDRAVQLSYFTVMMKARQYDRRFFIKGIQPHIYAVHESNGFPSDVVDYFVDNNPEIRRHISNLLSIMKDGRSFGSLIKVGRIDFNLLYQRVEQINDDINLFRDGVINELLPLINAARLLSLKYHVVVTNPPYLGGRKLNDKILEFLSDNYAYGKADLFSAFIIRCRDFTLPLGYRAMITQQAWMFLTSYEALRKDEYQSEIINMAQLGARAFDEIGGEVVQTTTFVKQNVRVDGYRGTYIRLTEVDGEQEKEAHFFDSDERYVRSKEVFEKIQGSPLAYWASDKTYDLFEKSKLLSDYVDTKQGLKSSDDKRFFRLWPEVDYAKIEQNAVTAELAKASSKKWFLLNKGGRLKWYGDYWHVINWENDGEEIKGYARQLYRSVTRTITSIDYYFRESISWPKITSNPVFRVIPAGFIFSDAGSAMFYDSDIRDYLLAFLNTSIVTPLTRMLNPTVNLGVGDMLNIPFVVDANAKPHIEQIVETNIQLAKADWDSFEVSRDFQQHPFIQNCKKISEAYEQWVQETTIRFQETKKNEEELNRIFIGIYGLEDELSPEVPDERITVRRADLKRDVKSFISYAVGCMFGRYALGNPGLIYAGGEWDDSKYTLFTPDRDAIIPICDDEYFEDDIVGRFVSFVEKAFGKEYLEENLRFIADALDGSGSSREVIRSYFSSGFYADHCTTYSVTGSGKRPIYWLFDSGKKNGFKCLIYMHRYQPDTIARIRTDYVHEQQSRYRTAIADLEQRINGASTSERVKLSKQLAKLQAQAEEIRVYEEKIHHLADQMIKIDLDDGVKHNYELFRDVLAKIK